MYCLKLYDEELIKFEMSEIPGEELKVSVAWFAADRMTVMPVGFDGTGASLENWLKRRRIPNNRAYAQKILHSMGLNSRNTMGILELCKGLSLNDSYWLVPQGFEGKFSEYNLYQNRFAEILALVALTGEGSGAVEPSKVKTTPEFTTDGMLPKAWFNNGGVITLYKGGAWRKYAEEMLEPFSEYYACQIAQAMGLKAVLYDLAERDGNLYSTCGLFTDIHTAYVPVGLIARRELSAVKGESYYTAAARWYKNFDAENHTDLYNGFASMLVFDSVIYNEDRHFNNFGLLRDNASGKIIGNAPIFDNGISLFNYASLSDLKDLKNYRLKYNNAVNRSFDETAREFCGEKQREQLNRLADFSFKKHKHFNMDFDRLGVIEEFLRFRVGEVLDYK
ncbi:MAG: XRE family transcriptional regulator [Oscillospiraceae bacterium]|nr:XRE family transcriptional regulator [Oscillospiraceae bacterium]